ncbi:MAG TPA: enoyl-CoA hydratase/isomerase family protein, partial [Desulfobacterales bacterium]|nr:enoyl-CoA hydratase/isomerase family protein [Desulfobacterales bacterium]
MDYECIIYEKKDQVGLIKLNRPKVLNAMNRQLWIEMQDALEIVKQDNEVKALIITGEGRAFSTGADLKDSKDRSIEDYRMYLES